MKAFRHMGIPVVGIVFVLTLAAQNQPAPELGTVRGIVTRGGPADALSNVQVTLEGGPIDPEVMQRLLGGAAGLGIVVTPPPGASLSETTQLLIDTAAARGLPIRAPAIQNLANRIVGGNAWPTTTSGPDGRFSFPGVRPGRYTVRAVLDGYFGKAVSGVYPPNGSIDVTVSGKDPVDATLTMVQGAIVSGRIYDASGQPLSNVNVQAFSNGYQNGFALLQVAASKATDDRGEYRLFWVPPGDYYIGVAPRSDVPVPAGSLPSAKTFYPGVTRLTEATTVAIRGGDNLSGIDISIRPAPSFKISGQVSSSLPLLPSPDGTPAQGNAVLMLVSRDLNAPDDTASRTLGNVSLVPSIGLFEVTNIPPGSYELFARVADPGGQGLQGFAWGHVPIDVEDKDIRGVAIPVDANSEVKGTVKGTSGAPLPSTVRIVLLPDGGASKIPLYQLVATRGTGTGQDGSFAVPAVPPGRFRVGAIAGLPANQYLADVRQGGMSVFDSGFDVGGKSAGPLEILIGSGAGTVEGTVQEGPLKPVAGAAVVLVPESRRIQNRALYFSTTSDASGRFTLRGLPPGEYQLFAWESVIPNAYQNSGFLAKHAGRARIVRVGQGTTVNVEVPVIPSGK